MGAPTAQARTAEGVAPRAADEAEADPCLRVAVLRRQRRTGDVTQHVRRQHRHRISCHAALWPCACAQEGQSCRCTFAVFQQRTVSAVTTSHHKDWAEVRRSGDWVGQLHSCCSQVRKFFNHCTRLARDTPFLMIADIATCRRLDLD